MPIHTEVQLVSPPAVEAVRIIGRLRDAGFIAYLAGGCVRDALLGRSPKDYDVATNATPESVREVFGARNTLAFGAAFGVIGVLPPKNRSSSRKKDSSSVIAPTEVATFRSDGEYSDGRRPDEVIFGDAEQDALRRDFTINGMFYDPHEQKVIDFVGGRADILDKRLRTIGSPDERFGEDKLRMLRAIRFATVLNFDLEQQTESAIIKHAEEIVQVSGERIGAEMRRVLVSKLCWRGLERLVDTKLAKWVMPSLDQVDRGEAKRLLDVIEHRCVAVSLACLAISHPHPNDLVDDAIARWKLSNEEKRKTLASMRHASLLTVAHEQAWSKLQPILVDRDAEEIVAVAQTLVLGRGLNPSGIQRITDALTWTREKLDPPVLIRGDDLGAAGIPAGPHYRDWLQAVRDAQLDGQLTSTEDAWELIESLRRR